MKRISFQIIEGVDKGKTFLHLALPVTIGREEGNAIRLNDDRISRFHAKIQEDQGQLVITDMDSTNGTRVNGETIQLRLLRMGDRINVGRSTLVFGSSDEISKYFLDLEEDHHESDVTFEGDDDEDGAIHTNVEEEVEFDFGKDEPVDVFKQAPPSLPIKLSPAQAAQLSELLDYLHRALSDATSSVHIPASASEARLSLPDWQRVQSLIGILARYARGVSEP